VYVISTPLYSGLALKKALLFSTNEYFRNIDLFVLKDQYSYQKRGFMLKSVLMSFTLALLFLCSVSFASQLPVQVRHYDSDDETSVLMHKTSLDIIPKIIINGQSYGFEEHSLSDIQRAAGGKINYTKRTSWLCFYSPQDKKAYWFLSNNEMQRGQLSAVTVSQADLSGSCTQPDHSLSVLYSVPGLLSQEKTISDYFGIGIKNANTLNFYVEKTLNKGISQINSVQYYFTGNEVSEIVFTQTTTL
jgi:hypothetical protein